MSFDRQHHPIKLGAILAAAILVGACANPRPAPVVNRTGMPEVQPPVATMPGVPVPSQTLPGAAVPSQGMPGGVEVSPIRGGGIESGSISATPVDPNLKTGPQGFKRPYGEMAAVTPPASPAVTTPGAGRPGAGVPSPVAGVPAVVATTAPPSVVASPPPAAAPPAGGAGVLEGVAFAWPAAGTVLQNFSETSSKGLSLGGKAGDVVRSAADGRVIFSGAGPRGYGNLIIVKHEHELLSVYAHNRSLAVKEGETVKRGQKIAELGNSGTDKPKLHFEIRQQGKPIDPLAVPAPAMIPALVFDIETIPDVAGLRAAWDLGHLTGDDAVVEAAAERRRLKVGHDFLPHHLQRVVAISCVFRDSDGVRVRSLGTPQDDEPQLIQDFFRTVDRYQPQIVSWNGGGFDLPVLHYRAMIHGVASARYWETGERDREFRYNNYLNRYHSRHLDLMDMLAMFTGRANAPLDEMARLCGFPGKLGMDGSKIWPAWRDGGIAAIRDYCETDVANTWLLYCRFMLINGQLSPEEYRGELELFRETIGGLQGGHWAEYLAAWPREPAR